MRARLLITALGAALFSLTGCGGSSDETTAGRPYTDANRICVEVAKRFADVQADSPRSFEQGEQLLAVLSKTAQDGEDALEQVVAPPLQALAFQRYLKSRREVGAKIDRGLQATKDEEGKTYERMRVAVNSGSDQRRRLAAAAGLEGCATAEHG